MGSESHCWERNVNELLFFHWEFFSIIDNKKMTWNISAKSHKMRSALRKEGHVFTLILIIYCVLGAIISIGILERELEVL